MTDTLAQFLEQILHVMSFELFKLGSSVITLSSILKLLLLVAFVILAESVLRRAFMQRVLTRTQLDEGMRFAIARIGGYLFITLGLYLSFTFVGIDLSSLAVLAGAIGVGLGFGLQNIVHKFISAIIILAERPIAIGDRVEVNGVAGKVAKISLRSTVVVTNDNISVIVPNSNFISEPVVNWSHGDPKVRINVPVGIAYGSDVEKFRKAMTEVALAHPQVLRDPPPNIFFIGFGESSLDFEIAVWTAEMLQNPKRFRSELNYAIEASLRKHQIEIPFPQRDLHIRSGSLPISTVPPAKID